jgi:phosphoribosylamine--glycine ligase
VCAISVTEPALRGMQILIVGGGGREHALAWKCAQSPRVERVYVAPGNGGTAAEPRVENLAIAADDLESLAAFAVRRGIALTIVGPEAPLAAGIVDRFRAAGLPCFGPDRAAAELEGSKTYAKEFLVRHGIPTAHYRGFTAAAPALDWLATCALPVVIKADGLAAGKGVVIAHDRDTAFEAARGMLSGEQFGAAGRRIVIEEFLAGEEASFIVMCDGRHALALASSQDHKTRDDGDRGPNTGGMGAYSPAPVVTPALHARVMREIVEPTLRGMTRDGRPYTGFLYAGLMIGPDGAPRVLEYNCRFGDPETQPILMRMRSDFVELCLAALAGTLDRCAIDWDPRAALGVVLAAEGYPGPVQKGDPISGLDSPDLSEVKIFHAATVQDDDGRLLTAGGRVLCITALGDGFDAARERAYRAVERVHWRGMFYRRDIGHRALARKRIAPG